jgi:hypothetical protein
LSGIRPPLEFNVFYGQTERWICEGKRSAMAPGHDCGFVGAILWAAALFTYNDFLLGVFSLSLLLLFLLILSDVLMPVGIFCSTGRSNDTDGMEEKDLYTLL